MKKHRLLTNVALALLVFSQISPTAAQTPAQLEKGFREPPDSARPWVYWFPLDGNISSNGITLDLEAMKRAGIGGVLYMETEQGTPRGPAKFAGPLWRDLFKHACAEARRLGLELNMNNDAGWCGSGGPWITPELSMQRVVWTETPAQGPQRFRASLKQPAAVAKYYRDIAVFAYPTPEVNRRIQGLQGKSAHQPVHNIPTRAQWPTAPAKAIVPQAAITNLTARMSADGQLTWDVPPGQWTILRLGHTTTGKDNHPAPIDGRGLECDKLSKEAAEAHFTGLMARLIADVGPLAGKTLVSTHIDSWEVGSQNWTPRFREEFQRLRGYDPLPFLPVMTGRIVESTEISERFLWDLRMTVNNLLLDNYAGHFRELAHRNGLRLSIEAYDGVPCDELAYGGRADEPMAEFWSWSKFGAAYSCTEMASSAHVYGRPILGAEAFTATDAEKWLGHPGNVKDLGDWAFCEGINRFVFHRYALQPWTDVRPGISMGPWGLHYERTQTWWEKSIAWHQYLARCQYLLQKGLFVADICFLSPEWAPQRFVSPVKSGFDRPGYNFDGCPPEALLTRMKVKDGRLVLPDGMSYRLLVLPQVETMTPELLRRIKGLVADGATVAGAPPLKSPSLSGYPKCDDEVQSLAQEIWGGLEPPPEIAERSFGKGRIIWGGEFKVKRSAPATLEDQFASAKWIWTKEGNPAAAAPPGKRLFRRVFNLDPSSPIDSARLLMTADNSFVCWVNGRRAGSGDSFARVYEMSVKGLLRPGTNLMAVEAVNATESPNPAGLIASLTIDYRDGHAATLGTDEGWEASMSAVGNWHADLAAGTRWAPALELGPLGMAPWGDLESSPGSSDPTPDIKVVSRLLDRMGVPPDFAFRSGNSSQNLRHIHRVIHGTDVYFVANKSAQTEDAVCSFRVRGRRPELWWPDTGRTERPAAYETADNCTRVPIHLDPYASVFVVFPDQSQAAPERIVRVTRPEGTVLDATVQPPALPAAQNNEHVTNDFTMAVWLNPDTDTGLLAETNRGLAGFAAPRNDALYPPPGHEVYDDPDQAGSGVAAGRNGICVFEHGADYFAPLLVHPATIANWTHVAVVYRNGRPALYLDGKLARSGLKSQFIVHPGVGVAHSRAVAPFKGGQGDWTLISHALDEREVGQLMNSTPRPLARSPEGLVALLTDIRGRDQLLANRAGQYTLQTASGRTRQVTIDALPTPQPLDGPWELSFPPNWGAPAKVTLDKLISWSDHPDPGVKYFSGTATYRKSFTVPSELRKKGRRVMLDLGRVEVMAQVKLNGKDLGILWKAPYQVDVSEALRSGKNSLELEVVNLWINRQIGDEQLPEDSDRNPEGTLKSWPKWLLDGQRSPAGRYTLTSWRLWKKNDPLQESGLIGPVKLRATALVTIPQR